VEVLHEVGKRVPGFRDLFLLSVFSAGFHQRQDRVLFGHETIEGKRTALVAGWKWPRPQDLRHFARRISVTPRRIIMTPIAARRRLEILPTAAIPPSPTRAPIRRASRKTPSTSMRLTVKAPSATGSPTASAWIRRVVRTAGPTMSGIPSGTTPAFSLGGSREAFAKSRS